MAMFEATIINLNLECKGLDGETKVFTPRERVTAEFSEKVIHEFEIYRDAQKGLPESEQDKMFIYYLKFLTWVYKDIDTKWIKANFSNVQVKEMFDWVNEGMLGAKKDAES